MVVDGSQGGGVLLGGLQDLQLAVVAHGQHAQRDLVGIDALITGAQEQTGFDVLNGQGEHGQNVVVIVAGLFKQDVQLVAHIQPGGVALLQGGILPVVVPDFLADLPDILHDLFGGDHVQQMLKPEVHVEDALGLLRLHQGEQHFQKVILLVQWDHGEHVLRNTLRLFEGVADGLCVGVVEAVNAGCEFFLEFLVAPAQQSLVHLFDFVVTEAVDAPYIADHGKQVQLFRIELLQKKCAVGLADDLQVITSPCFLI